MLEAIDVRQAFTRSTKGGNLCQIKRQVQHSSLLTMFLHKEEKNG